MCVQFDSNLIHLFLQLVTYRNLTCTLQPTFLDPIRECQSGCTGRSPSRLVVAASGRLIVTASGRLIVTASGRLIVTAIGYVV